jgi:hypothetical protein
MATPIGPKRALRRTAAMNAANAPPPVPRTAATANWADPEKAITEKTIGARSPQPRERARTPKEIPSTSVARANGIAARAPARYRLAPSVSSPLLSVDLLNHGLLNLKGFAALLCCSRRGGSED